MITDGSEIAFQCVLSLLRSTWTVCLQATKANSDVIGQYYLDYEVKPECFRPQQQEGKSAYNPKVVTIV